jgi:zinc protease
MTIAIRPQPGPAREYHFPRFSTRTLENGITVVVAPVKKLPLVSVAAVIDATALSDETGKEGLAELTAQALKEGTELRDGSRLALDLERLGTSFESGADWDSTVASMTVLSEKLPAAFEIFAQVLRAPAFREADVERLKAERLAERIQILDEPRGLADESFNRFIYAKESRYSKPMSGNSTSIKSITRDDVHAFFMKNYVPAAMRFVIAGDIDVNEAVELVSSALGDWKSGEPQKPAKADIPSRQVRAVEVVAKPEAAQSELRIGHIGVPRMHPDYFNIVVMNAVLGGLFSSRINLNLREAHGYTYGASSYFDWRRQAGPFIISTAVQSEVTAAAISESLKEIDRMRGEKISNDELTLATSYLQGVFPIRYETTSAIASALANLVTFGLPDDYYDTYRDNIAAVTEESVLAAAREYVQPDHLQVSVVGNPEIIVEPMREVLGEVSVREPEKD